MGQGTRWRPQRMTEFAAQRKGTHLYVDAGTAVHVPQMNFLMAVSVAKQQQQQHLFQKGHGTMHGLYSVGVGATEGAVYRLERVS